jgi:hypothetical protein
VELIKQHTPFDDILLSKTMPAIVETNPLLLAVLMAV